MRIRRYFFSLNREGEVISSLERTTNGSQVQDGLKEYKRVQHVSSSELRDPTSMPEPKAKSRYALKQDADISTTVRCEKSMVSSIMFSERSGARSLSTSNNQAGLLYYSVSESMHLSRSKKENLIALKRLSLLLMMRVPARSTTHKIFAALHTKTSPSISSRMAATSAQRRYSSGWWQRSRGAKTTYFLLCSFARAFSRT